MSGLIGLLLTEMSSENKNFCKIYGPQNMIKYINSTKYIIINQICIYS